MSGSRASHSRALSLGVGAAVAMLLACGPPPVETLDPEKLSALRRDLERGAPPEVPAAAVSPAAATRPPKTDDERRRRAQRALPSGETLGSLQAVGEDDRYAFSLAVRRGNGADTATLRLFDLGVEPAAFVAAHDFGAGALRGALPSQITGALAIQDDSGRPVLLAEMRSADGAAAACGWWLASERPRLVCVPAHTERSRRRVLQGALFETWPAEAPTEPIRSPGQSGREIVFTGGGWQEVGAFRCLGRELEGVLGEADARPLGEWQRGQVESRRRAALRAADQLESARAVTLLEDALSLDACDVDSWRLLGRLQHEAGRPARAVPALAVAVALRPHGEAALLDLADALVALDGAGTAEDGAGEAWVQTRRVLESRKGGRALLAEGEIQQPRELARRLYERFLVLTEGSAPRLGPQRRRAREQIERLSGATRASP